MNTFTKKGLSIKKLSLVWMAVIMLILPACRRFEQPLAEKIVIHGWVGYLPQTVMDAFTKEYGVEVDYQTYNTQEEAIEEIKQGKVVDLLVMGHDLVDLLMRDGLLAEIDHSHIPNMKNISPTFLNPAFDPGNKYSIMIQWGTTGILYRKDLVQPPPTRWADLWNPRYQGEVGIWAIQRDVISIALKSLGYSVNTENPDELKEAEAQLRALKANVFFFDPDLPSSVEYLLSGEAVMGYGWPYDFMEAQEQSQDILYILPEEGAILYGDNFTIPANSSNKYTAELFIDFYFRPQISAMVTNETFLATPNQAASRFIIPEILNDPVVFPSEEDLKNAEILFPLSPEGVALYDEIWNHFTTGSQ